MLIDSNGYSLRSISFISSYFITLKDFVNFFQERKNVIHLVEVTSAYIKELEGSLEESKAKINDLQKSSEGKVVAQEITVDGVEGTLVFKQ